MATLLTSPVKPSRRATVQRKKLSVQAALQLAAQDAAKRLKADGFKLPTQSWDSPHIKNPVR
jgi:type II secretory pathway pseudopilin PulG